MQGVIATIMEDVSDSIIFVELDMIVAHLQNGCNRSNEIIIACL